MSRNTLPPTEAAARAHLQQIQKDTYSYANRKGVRTVYVACSWRNPFTVKADVALPLRCTAEVFAFLLQVAWRKLNSPGVEQLENAHASSSFVGLIASTLHIKELRDGEDILLWGGDHPFKQQAYDNLEKLRALHLRQYCAEHHVQWREDWRKCKDERKAFNLRAKVLTTKAQVRHERGDYKGAIAATKKVQAGWDAISQERHRRRLEDRRAHAVRVALPKWTAAQDRALLHATKGGNNTAATFRQLAQELNKTPQEVEAEYKMMVAGMADKYAESGRWG